VPRRQREFESPVDKLCSLADKTATMRSGSWSLELCSWSDHHQVIRRKETRASGPRHSRRDPAVPLERFLVLVYPPRMPSSPQPITGGAIQ
jgi:hypothetical protein